MYPVAVSQRQQSNILDRSVTGASSFYSNNIYANQNDSTHVVLQVSDSATIVTQLYAVKTPDATPVAIQAQDSTVYGGATLLKAFSFKGLPSAYYAYVVKATVIAVDKTSNRVRLRYYSVGD